MTHPTTSTTSISVTTDRRPPVPRSRPLRPRVARAVGRWRRRRGGSAGQTTAEYALVILGAAGLATLLIAWATKSDAVGKLFDSVVQKILP